MTIKSACVVGGAGFLGSHVVHSLRSQGWRVKVVDDLSIGKVKHIPEDVELSVCDISSPNITVKHLAEHFRECSYVFNYAAKPFIPDCFEDPLGFVNTNIVGAMKVLDACMVAGVERILQVSSAEVYGNNDNQLGLISEDTEFDPPSTYASTKAAIDNLCRARYNEAGVPVIILRQFNCVGERETHAYVIPEIIQQLSFSNFVHLGSNTSRDFLYAGDAANIAIDLIQKGKPGEAYNLGSEICISIYDLALIIGSLMRPSDEIHIVTDSTRFRPCDIYHLCSNNTKIYDTVSVRPKHTLREALIKTIEYFKQNNHSWDW